VAIRSSASQEVRRLVADLTAANAADTTRHDAAIARLAVIGTRAIRQLLEALATADRPTARASLLLALEVIPDPRALEPILSALAQGEQPEVRLAAARAARGLLVLPQGAMALDRLTTLAMNRTEPAALRALALEALTSLPARTVKPVLEQLKDDPAPEIRAVLRRAGGTVEDPVADLEEASDGWLPREPGAVLQLVARAAQEAPLSTLHRLVERVRSKESEGRRSRRRDWRVVRGALHLALARRGSRVALYDLREALEQSAEPLPADFVEALLLIGDATVLEPLAGAFVQSAEMADAEAWRRSLADAFRAVVERHGITRRHRALKRVQTRYGPLVDRLVSHDAGRR
jgi:HEAT repeat protein